jgi:hypothetical protein
MEISQETLVGGRTYRYSLGSQVSYLVRGVFFVAIGYLFLTQDHGNAPGGPLLYWAASVGCFLGAAYFAISAAYSVVFFDQESVTVRGVFFTQSIRRRSVSGYLVVPGSRYQGPAIRLISDSPGESNLDVPKLYAFDGAWHEWISSLPDQGQQQIQEEEDRFTLK